MIERAMVPTAQDLFGSYPILTVTGPRQSGKTTLVRRTFSELPYVNLEDIVHREFASSDPVAFMSRFSRGAVLDEIQRVPRLLSQIQVAVDESGRNGQFVLTGSSQFQLLESVSQSLAGRTALLQLWPLTIAEVDSLGFSPDFDDLLYRGFYPRIHAGNLDPTRVLGDYFETYVERDLRSFARVRELSLFRRFMRLCAGRVGQLLNMDSLANDVGVSRTTIKHWLSILEASFVIFLLQPWHANLRKRLVKSPKLYFHDVGLAAFLLGAEKTEHIYSHPLRGSLFENLVIAEIFKHRCNAGRRLNMTFYRDAHGNEVDCVIDLGGKLYPIEIKSSATMSRDFFKGFTAFDRALGRVCSERLLVLAGTMDDVRSEAVVTNPRDLPARLEAWGI